MIKNNKLLTIITVIKNDDRRLKITLKSLKKLYNDPSFEYIIVENIDKKKILFLSKKLQNNIFIGYYNDNNNKNGIYNAMNIGINKAKGKYILFLNAGDELLYSLNKMKNLLKKIIINYIHADILFFNSCLTLNSQKMNLKPNQNFSSSMPTSHQAMFFKSSFVKEHKFDLRYRVAADFNLVLKANHKNLIFLKHKKPVTKIEYGGFSSNNYLISYYEYLKIIYFNNSGFIKFKELFLLFVKGIIICFLKSIFTEKFLFYMKIKFY